MSGYDYSQEDANEMLEAADKRIAALAAELAEERRDHDNCRHNRKENLRDLTRAESDKAALAAKVATLESTLRSMVNAWEPDEGGSDYQLWLCAKSVLRGTLETPAEPEKCQHGILWRGPVCMDCVNEAFGHQSKTKGDEL